MEDKENKAVQLSEAPSPDKYSEWDDALALSIREVKRPAAKQRLPFSDTPVKRNALLVPLVKGTTTLRTRAASDEAVTTGSDSSSRRGVMDDDM